MILNLVKENPMSASSEPLGFETLDACHQQIHTHLNELAALARHIEVAGVDAKAQQQAGAIETFFSETSRQHHAQEETHVFPVLLASGDTVLETAVRSLQQDHGWLEENWIELAPQLRAIASGNNWFEISEFQHDVQVFLDLYHDHLMIEETVVYPEAKTRLARATAKRA
jgi:hemerythrin-like domain-containing protein